MKEKKKQLRENGYSGKEILGTAESIFSFLSKKRLYLHIMNFFFYLLQFIYTVSLLAFTTVKVDENSSIYLPEDEGENINAAMQRDSKAFQKYFHIHLAISASCDV